MQTPSPAMNNSPGTPTGRGLLNLSKMYSWVFEIAFPMFILSAFVKSFREDHTAVSVGPYIL